MARRILIAALFAAAASAQTSDRTFYVPHVQTTADLQTMVNVVRSVGEIQQVTADFPKKAITVTGNTAQLAFADWASHELDNPAPSNTPREYRIAAADPPIVRIYHLTYLKTPQEIQEATNAIRSVADVQRFFPYNASPALVARGNADQMATVDFLVHELDQAGPVKTSADFPMPWTPRWPEVAKVFAIRNATPLQLQELVNLTRSVADLQRFFPFNPRHVIVARGTAEQLAIAAWVIQQLDSDEPTPPLEYRTTDKLNPVISIAFLPETVSTQTLQETVNAVRTATKMQRVYPDNRVKAIAMRGTADQISRAGLMLKEPIQ